MIFLPKGENDFIRYAEGVDSKSEILNSIDIPVLILFGDSDECVLTQSIDLVKQYLKNNIKKCNIEVIKGANHSYKGKYQELENSLKNFEL